MEDKIPLHYNAVGNIDRWGSKYESFVFPAIIIIVTLFWGLFLRYFKKKQITETDEKAVNEARMNEKVIYLIALGMALMFGIKHYFIMFSSYLETKNQMSTMAIDINMVTNIMIALFMIIIGNFLPKARLNSVVGIRTVWSMKNDKTWAKTNRLSGIILIISGLLIIIETILIGGLISTFIMVGILLLATITAAVLSYKVASNQAE